MPKALFAKVAGTWGQVFPPLALFNEATGGTVTEIADYNGTGERWRTHTWLASDPAGLTITNSVAPFRVFVVGGGGGAGGAQGAGGAGGGVGASDTWSPPVGNYPVTVGLGGRVNGGNGGVQGGDGFVAVAYRIG